MRALADVKLPLNELNVLIGENGSGKSTLIEAFELLRKAARPGQFVYDVVHNLHGGLAGLLRYGCNQLALEISVEGNGPKLIYEMVLGLSGNSPEIVSEKLDVCVGMEQTAVYNVLQRNGLSAQLHDMKDNSTRTVEVSLSTLAIASFGLTAQPAFRRILNAFERIDVHPSFDTRPIWLQTEQQQRDGMRTPQLIEQAETITRFGINLANCYQTLRNTDTSERSIVTTGQVQNIQQEQFCEPENTWERVLEQVRLGLGDDLRDITLHSPRRGYIELMLHFGRLKKPIPASLLSEGQLAYLGFVALSELGTSRSIIVFDEPEAHLHPNLLIQVVWMLESLAKSCPVVVATHSDRFLDALSNPAETVILCQLDQHRAVTLHKPNTQSLEDWLTDYRGLGQIREEGYTPHIFTQNLSYTTDVEQ
jgi:predicted ATPase